MRSSSLTQLWLGAALGVGLVTACGGGAASGGGGSRPAVMPLLSELPTDPAKRDAILDQSGQTAGPEHRKGQTRRERKAETAAATAAAILGGMFSKTQNVTFGSAGTFDENDLAPTPIAPPRPAPVDGADAGAGSAADDARGAPLVPWVILK